MFYNLSRILNLYLANSRGTILVIQGIILVLPFLNSPNDLDPSYKMDLDFWDCFGRKKNSVL